MKMTTPKGTELPILDLRGKPYLQVAHRIVWFREEHPDWIIKTTFIERAEDYTICQAEIFDETGKFRAMAHKKETAHDFKDHLEKAETSSIGRALALLGYGTQFAPDIEEGERLADSPIDPATKKTLQTIKDTLGPIPSELKAMATLADKTFPKTTKDGRPHKFAEKTFREVITTQDGIQYAMFLKERIPTTERSGWVKDFLDYSRPFVAKEFGK